MIHNHDVRADPHCAAVLQGHQQEVCGLKWSLQVLAPPSSLAPPLQTQPLHRFVARPRVPKAARRWSELAAPAPVRGGMGGAAVRRWPAAGSSQGTQLASGGNDNLLHIWEPRQGRPRLCIERHAAAVKALAWCPFQHNVLASGGGTADRKICLWNTGNGQCLNEVDTKSQARPPPTSLPPSLPPSLPRCTATARTAWCSPAARLPPSMHSALALAHTRTTHVSFLY